MSVPLGDTTNTFDLLRLPTCVCFLKGEGSCSSTVLKGGSKTPTCPTTESSGRVYIFIYLFKVKLFSGVSGQGKVSVSYEDWLLSTR